MITVKKKKKQKKILILPKVNFRINIEKYADNLFLKIHSKLYHQKLL